jgi:hypothetical protein
VRTSEANLEVSWQSLLFEEEEDRSILSTASNALRKPVFSSPLKSASSFRSNAYSVNSEDLDGQFQPNALFSGPSASFSPLQHHQPEAVDIPLVLDQLKKDENGLLRPHATRKSPAGFPVRSLPPPASRTSVDSYGAQSHAESLRSLRKSRTKHRQGLLGGGADAMSCGPGESLSTSADKRSEPTELLEFKPLSSARTGAGSGSTSSATHRQTAGPGGIIVLSAEEEANSPGKKSFPMWDSRKS